jgi:hypothetical protein
VSAAAELGEAGQALRAAAGVDPRRLPEGLRSRQAQVHLDVAWAQAQRKRDAEAILDLLEAERVAPQAAPSRAGARDRPADARPGRPPAAQQRVARPRHARGRAGLVAAAPVPRPVQQRRCRDRAPGRRWLSAPSARCPRTHRRGPRNDERGRRTRRGKEDENRPASWPRHTCGSAPGTLTAAAATADNRLLLRGVLRYPRCPETPEAPRQKSTLRSVRRGFARALGTTDQWDE